MDGLLDATLLYATLRVTTPVLLAAMGGVLCEVSGFPNIALEGLMLVAAFFAVVVSAATGSAALGLLAAVAAAVALAAVLAFVVLDLRADPIIAGFATIIAAGGLTVFLMSTWFGDKGSYSPATVVPLPRLDLPGLERVPLLGPALDGQNVLVYVALLLVPAVHLLLFRTPFGLRLRAAGESPEAATSVGLDVRRLRYAAVLLSGVCCGLAGANLSLGYLNMFVRGMTAGRGFIALAAVLLGGTTPYGTLLASLGFGFAEALAVRLQTLQLPAQLVLMLPYLATAAATAAYAIRRARRAR